MKRKKTIVYKENEWSLGKISNSRGIDGCLSSLSKIHSFIDQCNWYCSFSFCNVCSTTFVNTQNKSSFVCIQKISCYHIFLNWITLTSTSGIIWLGAFHAVYSWRLTFIVCFIFALFKCFLHRHAFNNCIPYNVWKHEGIVSMKVKYTNLQNKPSILISLFQIKRIYLLIISIPPANEV